MHSGPGFVVDDLDDELDDDLDDLGALLRVMSALAALGPPAPAIEPEPEPPPVVEPPAPRLPAAPGYGSSGLLGFRRDPQADTASLLRELSSLGDDPSPLASAAPGRPSAPRAPAPTAAGRDKKRRGLFGGRA